MAWFNSEIPICFYYHDRMILSTKHLIKRGINFTNTGNMGTVLYLLGCCKTCEQRIDSTTI